MATAEANGIKFYDPVTSMLEGYINSYFSNKNSKENLLRQISAQKSMIKWSSQNLPTFQRQGLESAGYNPMLALGNIGGYSAGSFSAVGQDANSSAESGFDREKWEAAKQARKQQENTTKIGEETAKKLEAEVKNIETQTVNDTLQTQSKLLNDEVEREKSKATTTNTSIKNWTEPIAAGLGTLGGVLGFNAIKKKGLLLALKDTVSPIVQGSKGLLSSSAKAIPKVLGSQTLGALGIGLPLMYGSAKAGEKAAKQIKNDKNSDYKKRKGFIPNAFGIPSYWQY